MPRAVKTWPPVAKLTLVSQVGRVVTVSTTGTTPGSTGNNKRTATPSTLASWELFWGDGVSQTGAGQPPVTLTHTYPADQDTVVVRLGVTDVNTRTATATLSLGTVAAPQIPNAPTALLATVLSDTSIRLDWTDTQGIATTYAVNRAAAGGAEVHIADVTGSQRTYTDTGLTAATVYSYRVQGVNVNGASEYSNTAAATTNPATPPVILPTAPSACAAALAGALLANVTWTDNANNEAGYAVERSVSGGSYAQIATVNADVVSYADLTLAYATTYAYRVRAFNAAGNSAYSTSGNITTGAAPTPPAPSAPTTLVATATNPTTIGLSWVDTSADETGFLLQRRLGTGGVFATLATLPANTRAYTDATCLPSTLYGYQVRAFNANGNSAFTAVASATTPALPPPQPPSCTITAVAAVINGTPVSFAVTATPGGAALASWVITWGDGTSQSGSGTPPSAPTKLYSSANTYLVTLTVTDTNGNTGVSNTTATVNPYVPPPPPPPVTYIDVLPGASLQAAINAASAGATFRLRNGTHRFTGTQVTPKQGNTIFGESTTGVIVNGAVVLSSWTQSGSYWSAAASAQAGSGANCQPGYPRCDYRSELFIDSVRIRQVDTLAGVTANTWFFDFTANRAYVGTNPAGRTVELSSALYAFGGTINDVTYADFTVEKFANPAQYGAMGGNQDATPIGTSWILNGLIVRLCHGNGIRVATGMQVLGCQTYQHGQQGIGGSGTGVLVDGLTNYENNMAGFYYGWEGGGSKFAATTNLIVRNSTFRNNLGPGLWVDINNTGYELYGNTCTDNTGSVGPTPGIYIEISGAGSIHDNTCLRNGLGFNQWLWGGGIVISSSGSGASDLEIYNNLLNGNAGGVTLVQNPRPEYGGNHITQRVHVHDNQITFAAGFNGAAQDIGDNLIFTSRSNRYDYNRYYMSGAAAFAWLNGGRDWTYWRATAGMDLHGTLNV